jgi:AraC-like DNA-binding protein
MVKKELIPGFIEPEKPDAGAVWALTYLSPYVRQSGNQWRPRWHIEARKLLDYLLVFIAAGEGVFTVAGKTFHVGANDAVFIPPDTLHEMSGNSEKMHCIYLHFDLIYDVIRSNWNAYIPAGTHDLSKFDEFMHPEIDDPFFSKLCGKLNLKNPVSLKALMIRICSMHTKRKADSSLRISGVMLELLSELKEQLDNEDHNLIPDYEKLIDAANFITENPELSLSIKKLAKKTGLSESHFRRQFRLVHGMGPKAMQLQAKMRKACELLTYWNMNVSEVAEELNFSSIHAFSRAFKNVQGIAPAQYLKLRNKP